MLAFLKKMPKKKSEELEAEGTSAEVGQDETAEDTAVEAKTDDSIEAADSTEAKADSEEKPKKIKKAKSADETTEEPSLVDSVFETVSSAVSGVAGVIADGVSAVVAAVTPDSSSTAADKKPHHSKRAEKIGIVQSDKMTKTVTVRVDRVVKHPVYRKYIKRRKQFMAHDELGSAIGDKVRIIETRPLSARKRWRVVEIVQKAEK